MTERQLLALVAAILWAAPGAGLSASEAISHARLLISEVNAAGTGDRTRSW